MPSDLKGWMDYYINNIVERIINEAKSAEEAQEAAKYMMDEMESVFDQTDWKTYDYSSNS
jgi:hypothetical protein